MPHLAFHHPDVFRHADAEQLRGAGLPISARTLGEAVKQAEHIIQCKLVPSRFPPGSWQYLRNSDEPGSCPMDLVIERGRDCFDPGHDLTFELGPDDVVSFGALVL